MTFKAGVRFKKWTRALSRILDTLDLLENTYTWLPELVITSVNDSKHMQKSRHYTNEAVDVRSKNFKTEKDKQAFIQLVREQLGWKFTILYESKGEPNEHFHIQVKKGETYP